MMPGGSAGGLAAGQADLSGHRRQGRAEERHSLLRMGRPARRRPLRQDGPQRHRIRRHAVDLRSLLTCSKRALGLTNDELVRRLRRVEPGRAGQLPDRNHARHFQRQGSRHRRLPGRRDPRHGRGEGDRQVDEPIGARPGRAQHAGDRGGLRPLPVGDEGSARAGQQSAAAGRRPSSTATAQEFIEASPRRRCTPRRFAATPRASCRCRRRPTSTTGRSNYGDIALLWRGGCIIRAAFLDRIKEAFDADPKLENLLLAPYFTEAVEKAQTAWRHVVVHGRAAGHSGAGLRRGAGLLRRLSLASGCRPTCCKPSAIISAPTPTSASTSPACSTATGCGCGRNRGTDEGGRMKDENGRITENDCHAIA